MIPNDVPLVPVCSPTTVDVGRGWYACVHLGLLLAMASSLALGLAAEVVDGGIRLFHCRLPETCASKLLLGRPCWGCGLTRSTVLALAGQWQASRATHPTGVWLAAFLVVQLLARLVLVLIRPKQAWIQRADLAVSLAGLVAVVFVPMLLHRY